MMKERMMERYKIYTVKNVGDDKYHCICVAKAPTEDRANRYLESMSENVFKHKEIFMKIKEKEEERRSVEHEVCVQGWNGTTHDSKVALDLKDATLEN